jgi:hypothetical protein
MVSGMVFLSEDHTVAPSLAAANFSHSFVIQVQ